MRYLTDILALLVGLAGSVAFAVAMALVMM